MDNLWAKPPFRAAVVVAGVALTLWFAYLTRAVLFPFAVAFVLAYLLDPLIDRLETWKINRGASILALLIVLASLTAAAGALLAPLVLEQVEAMGKNLPGYIDTIERKITPLIEKIPELNQDDLKAKVREAMAMLGDLPMKALQAAAAGLWSGLTGAMGLIVALFNLVLIPVLTFYLLRDFDLITAAIAKRIPPRHNDRAQDIAKKIDAVLSGFFRGQLMVALFMATVLSIGLLVIGVPMGMFIGIVAGLSNIVPYLPLIVGFIPSMLFAWLGFGDWQHLLMVAALFGGAQMVEGFVITPRVLEKAVGLHPVAVMASLLIGGSFFGFIGVLLAVPAAAVIKVALAEMDAAYLSSRLYTDTKPDGE